MTHGWNALALTGVALFLKMFLTAGAQGVVRLRTRTFVNAEDARVFGRTTASAADHPIAERAQRALRNDLENIPIFLFLALCYVQLGCWPGGVDVYFPLFVLARCGHTLAFVRPTQPLRNRCYLLGQLVNIALCVHLVLAVLRG